MPCPGFVYRGEVDLNILYMIILQFEILFSVLAPFLSRCDAF